MKRPIVEARPDPNFAGLRVCSHGCADEIDPYRLPARKTEKISLQYPRPDVGLTDSVPVSPDYDGKYHPT